MTITREIFRNGWQPTTGKTVTREAVRGIILRGTQLFMIQSGKYGEFKFPGGGREQGESLTVTLAREIREETGAIVETIGENFCNIVEHGQAKEAEFDNFQMTSYYFLCRVSAALLEQQLDPYEQDYDYKPCWVEIKTAIQKNREILQNNPAALKDKIPWVMRETFVLEKISEQLLPFLKNVEDSHDN